MDRAKATLLDLKATQLGFMRCPRAVHLQQLSVRNGSDRPDRYARLSDQLRDWLVCGSPWLTKSPVVAVHLLGEQLVS